MAKPTLSAQREGMEIGDKVRTAEKLTSKMLSNGMFRRAGVEGTVLEQLEGTWPVSWRVRHEDGTEASYEEEAELTVIEVPAAKSRKKGPPVTAGLDALTTPSPREAALSRWMKAPAVHRRAALYDLKFKADIIRAAPRKMTAKRDLAYVAAVDLLLAVLFETGDPAEAALKATAGKVQK